MHADAGTKLAMLPTPPPLAGEEKPLETPKKRHGFGAWWLWLLVLVVVAGIAAYAWWRSHDSSAASAGGGRGNPANRPLPVVAATARTGDVPIYLKGLGAVTPFNVVTVHTRVDGQILKLTFKEGQTVHEGDLLAELDSRPFEVQLTQAQGQMQKDQAELKNAKSTVDRDREAKDAIAAQQLDTDIAAAAQLEGAVKIDQGQIDSANLQISYCRITSPITGRVGLQLVNMGNIVHAADQNGIAVITQLQPIAVEFSLPEDNIAAIIKGKDSVPPLPLDIYDREDSKKITQGTLLAIDSQIDPTTGMVKLKATCDNADNALFPSQFVNVHLLVDTKKSVVIVPTAAVQLGPDSVFVYVVHPGDESADKSAGHDDAAQIVEVRNVTVGPDEGDDTSILQGLSANDIVVVNGVDKLQDKSKVTVRMVAATQPAAGADAAAGASATTQPGKRSGSRRHQAQ